NVRIGCAAANVAAHVFTDILIGVGMALAHAGNRRHDLPWRAVAALEGVLFDEGLLHRMQPVALGQALDRRDLMIPGGERQCEARHHAAAVDQDGAGATLPMVATLLAA